MIGIYFSGTGNTKFCVDRFLQYYNAENKLCSYPMEDRDTPQRLAGNKDIVFGYPVYYSNIPIIVKKFILDNQMLFQNKNIFIIATMGLFSGDGAGCSARLLKKCGADIIGGLHVKMPDSIGDVKALKRSLEENKRLVQDAEAKIKKAATGAKQGKASRDGLSGLAHMAGLLGQRLYFYKKTDQLRDKLKINPEKCIMCGKCVRLCPMKNLETAEGMVRTLGNCTSCYRCISQCPKQAITLIGKQVVAQGRLELYVDEAKNLQNLED